MNRWRPPSSATTFFVTPGYLVSRSCSTSRSVSPSTLTFGSPPACLRRIVGSFTCTAMGSGSSVVSGRDAAEGFVVDQLGDRRLLAAHRAVGVPADLHFLEAHVESVVQQQPALERVALAGDQLDRFRGLDRTDHARE